MIPLLETAQSETAVDEGPHPLYPLPGWGAGTKNLGLALISAHEIRAMFNSRENHPSQCPFTAGILGVQ